MQNSSLVKNFRESYKQANEISVVVQMAEAGRFVKLIYRNCLKGKFDENIVNALYLVQSKLCISLS